MGATTFETLAMGKDAREAFNRAQEQEGWEHGHGGYSGTIVEKPGFVTVPLPPRVKVHRFLEWIDLATDASYLEYAKEDLARAEAQLKAAKPGTIRNHQAWVRRAKSHLKEVEVKRAKYVRTVGSHRALVEKYQPTYDDKWGPCLAFQINGAEGAKIKERAGRKGTHDKVFLFAGWASC
jgi:hypothetical protein